MQKKYFENVLYSNQNRNIGLHLTNNRFVEGILLDVKPKHIVLKTNENIVYFAIHQIQALSQNTTDLSIVKESIPHLVRDDMTDVLIALRYHWVTLNKYNNHNFFGVLSCIYEDYIILIHNKELLYVPISHITDISSEVSINEYAFLNKKEQVTIQQLYRSGLSKESFEIKADSLILEQEEVLPSENTIALEVIEPTNEEKAVHKESSSIKDNSSITELVTSLKSVLEKNSLTPAFEEIPEIIPTPPTNHLEENSNSDEELTFSINPLKTKGKGVLLTAWSTMNSDQSTVELPKETNRKTKTKTTSLSNQLMDKLNSEDIQEISNNMLKISEKKKNK